MTVMMQIALPDDVYRFLVAQADRCGTHAHKLAAAALTSAARANVPDAAESRTTALVRREAAVEAREKALARRTAALDARAARIAHDEAAADAKQAASDALNDRIIELNGQGWGDALIAADLGLSVSATNRRRRMLGLPNVGKSGRPRKVAA